MAINKVSQSQAIRTLQASRHLAGEPQCSCWNDPVYIKRGQICLNCQEAAEQMWGTSFQITWDN